MKPNPFKALAVLALAIFTGIFVHPIAAALFVWSQALAWNMTPTLGALNPSAGLKLDTIMWKAARALKKRLSPILSLSTVMRDQPLTETDTIKVPFYSLETLASKDFDGSYDFEGADGGNGFKDVVVNRRKYQALEFTSKELRRNSVLDLGMILDLKIEKLAEDVLDDIFSVVTQADFGEAILETSAANFDRNDVADLRVALTQARWPKVGRSLLLESAYEGNLVKDLLQVDKSGTDAALREGSSGRLVGFDIYDHPNMPENGERLVGAAILPFAILTAFSPIEPADEVRANMSDYRKYTVEGGLTLEYRSWGDPNSDSAKRVVEINYGSKKGDTAQLKRIERPA